MIGIIVAMDKELSLLTPHIADRQTGDADGFTFVTGCIDGREVVVAKCGIGKVNAALGASAMLRLNRPSLVINTGVAGGACTDVHVLDVVVGERVAYHDVWCGPGTVVGQADGCPRYFTPPAALLETEALRPSATLKQGLICSGDIFVDKGETVRRIAGDFPEVLAIDMESAAIAQTCHLAGVPFLSLRVLSDNPASSEDNISQYENFWDVAPQRTFEVLLKLIKEIK